MAPGVESMVRDEEDVSGQKGEVVEQVHGKIGDVVVEDVLLKALVGRGEGAGPRGQLKDSPGHGERGEGPVEERSEGVGQAVEPPPRPTRCQVVGARRRVRLRGGLGELVLPPVCVA